MTTEVKCNGRDGCALCKAIELNKLRAAIAILEADNRRPIDRLDLVMVPAVMPEPVVKQFVCEIYNEVCERAKTEFEKSEISGKRFRTEAANYQVMVENTIGKDNDTAYRAARMMRLLVSEQVGFGGRARRAAKAHVRMLLGICRRYVKRLEG